jgi:hypothetical protein
MSNGIASKLTGWFGNVNNILTAFGAIVASVAAIFSAVNKGKIDHINQQVAALELNQKMQKASSDFADLFLTKVLPDPLLSDPNQKRKHIQALLSVLNIVAQTNSTDKEGANAKARAIVPLQLALLLSQPGGLAAMDVNYNYLDDWVAMACADDSDSTRVTAIQALGGICQKALREGRLDVVSKGVDAVDQLFALLAEPKDPKDDIRIPAAAARLQLASFIKKQDVLLQRAKWANLADDEQEKVRARIRMAFSDSVEKAQGTTANLQKAATELDKSALVPDQKAKLEQNLGQLQAALASASDVARQQIARQGGGGNAPNASVATKLNVDELLKKLAAIDPERQRAISQLALLGQPAVKPMLEELYRRFPKNASPPPEDTRTRIAIATALKLMRQPILLDQTDSWFIVSLLSAPEENARDFTTDFLTSAFPEDTLNNLYAALDTFIEPFLYSNSAAPNTLEQNGVSNAVFIVATWARSLDASLQSPEKGKSMSVFCKEKADEWKIHLEKSPHRAAWTKTIDLLNRVLQRAASSGQQGS